MKRIPLGFVPYTKNSAIHSDNFKGVLSKLIFVMAARAPLKSMPFAPHHQSNGPANLRATHVPTAKPRRRAVLASCPVFDVWRRTAPQHALIQDLVACNTEKETNISGANGHYQTAENKSNKMKGEVFIPAGQGIDFQGSTTHWMLTRELSTP
jgi:hypothetical protein